MPKVSICIPAYQQPELLSKTLDSISVQDYKDYEVIITDDSLDDSVEKLVEGYDFEGRLKYIRNQEKKGTPENWNEAIRFANGEYIKIMHHDDWFRYEYSLSEFVKLLDENLNIDIAFSASFVLFADGRNWVHKISKRHFNKLKKEPLNILLGNLIGAPSATIYRKKGLIFFDANLKWLVDVDFYIQKINHVNVSYTQKDLVTTFGAEGRVTDICNKNKNIEIFEYFYVFDKNQNSCSKHSKISLIKSALYLAFKCHKYSIRSLSEIRDCGYTGRIPFLIRMFFKLRQLVTLKIRQN